MVTNLQRQIKAEGLLATDAYTSYTPWISSPASIFFMCFSCCVWVYENDDDDQRSRSHYLDSWFCTAVIYLLIVRYQLLCLTQFIKLCSRMKNSNVQYDSNVQSSDSKLWRQHQRSSVYVSLNP